MSGGEMRKLRQRLGLTQQEFADALEVNRLTILQYERGFRSSDRKAVLIPRIVEMACLALWARLPSYKEALGDIGASDRERAQTLPPDAVPDALKSMAIRKLKQRGVELGKFTFFFPWNTVRDLWGEIDEWNQGNSPA